MDLLLAPIVITPTKALTPSHVKGLLWLDVLYKSTSRLADVTYLWNLRPYNVTAQTMEYWEYLDRTFGADVDYSTWSEPALTAPYVRMHAERAQAPFPALRPYQHAVEAEGYVHPASRRLVELWRAHLARLGVADPGIATNDAPALSVEDVASMLAERGLCLDHRRYGGPLFVDATAHGLPLRRVVTADGQANYVMSALRQLLPLVGRHDRLLLVCEPDIEADYVLLQSVLSVFGADVSRLTLGRVALGSSLASSRHGGWERWTVDALTDVALADFSPAAVRLGLRLYFIAVLARDSGRAFEPQVLRKQLRRAERLLAAPCRDDEAAGRDFLAPLARRHGWVDPYRLTASLLERHRAPAPRTVLEDVFL